MIQWTKKEPVDVDLESENELEKDQESENLLNLLYSIAQDKALLDGTVHRSITCNHCQTSPVRGFRFKCANCVDFDLCQNCEALEVHNPTHNFIKIRIPIPPLANPRSILFEPFYPGPNFSVPKNIDFTDLERQSHFDHVEILGFYHQYLSLSTVERPGGGITRQTFNACLGPLGSTRNLIIDRMFLFFDTNSDQSIDFPEMIRGLSILCKGSLEERIVHAFKGYDLNNDGVISRDEFRAIFKAYFHLSMELVRDVVKVMEENLMATFDDEAAKPVSASFPAPSRISAEEESELQTKQQFVQDEDEVVSPLATVRDTLETIRKRSLPKKLVTFDAISPFLSPKSPIEEEMPIVEVISQDAIEELVSSVYVTAKTQSDLDLNMFRQVVQQDMNLLAWFEALGSIF
ncbi:hypothetical protein EDD86DRAFT_203495 [Gorgonomyces haynaldii]|nr:hypothetical protein EDD86DRAFT_203495 [Gorgonomyces haynaldii]